MIVVHRPPPTAPIHATGSPNHDPLILGRNGRHSGVELEPPSTSMASSGNTARETLQVSCLAPSSVAPTLFSKPKWLHSCCSLHQPGGLEAWVMSTLRMTFGTSRCHGHAWQVGQTGTHARIAGLQKTTNLFLSCPALLCSTLLFEVDLCFRVFSRKPFARQLLPHQSASSFHHLYDMSCVCHTLPGQVVGS